ncbi:coil containing protein [Vibrio phage 1.121.O._10N.286.46.C4]|nr:coil containing protein [Vibrio phage 1.121.O._10N.286.46.C4]
MFYDIEKNDLVFDYWNNRATSYATELREKFFELFDSYIERVTTKIHESETTYRSLYQEGSEVYVYLSQCGTKVVHLYIKEDYDPLRGEPKPLTIQITATDKTLQGKLNKVYKKRLTETYEKLVEEVLRIKKENNLKVLEN